MYYSRTYCSSVSISQDHPLLTSVWTVSSNDTLDELNRNATLQSEALNEWLANRTGPDVLSAGSQWGWLRLPDNSSIFENTTDPSAGPTSGHYELIFTVSISGPSYVFETFAECACLLVG